MYKIEAGLKCVDEEKERDGRLKFREAIKLDKLCPPAYLYLSDSYIRENRYDDALTELKRFITQVPVLIAIVGKPSINQKWYVQDTSLVSMNMMLMAWALKIGTCWIGTMDREKAKSVLDIEKNDFLLTILPLGYIEGEIPSPPHRKAMNQIRREI